MMITVELPLEDGELLLNALDRVLAAEPQSADGSNSYRARQADALITLCRSALSDPAPVDSVAPSKLAAPAKQSNPPLRGGVDEGDVVHCDAASSAGAATEAAARAPLTAVSTTANYEVVVHTDASALADRSDSSAEGSADRADLPIETIRRLCCDGSVVPISNGSQGQPLHIGRKRRTVSTALKRALLARDRHCQFPGCSHNRFVDAHHIQHWAHGGATSLENLMLLCGHHHRLMHEGGFQVVIDSQGRRAFRRPDGRCVPANGYRPQDHSEE
jgi:hypothetical protein